MKSIPTIIVIIVCFFTLVPIINAQDIQLIVPIPGIGGEETTSIPASETSLAEYVRLIYLFGIGVGALLAMLMIVYGGFKYIASGIITEKSAALGTIRNAALGLVLLLGAYLVLYIINPALVGLEQRELPTIRGRLTAEERQELELILLNLQATVFRLAEQRNVDVATRAMQADLDVIKRNTELASNYINEGYDLLPPFPNDPRDTVLQSIEKLERFVNELEPQLSIMANTITNLGSGIRGPLDSAFNEINDPYGNALTAEIEKARRAIAEINNFFEIGNEAIDHRFESIHIVNDLAPRAVGQASDMYNKEQDRLLAEEQDRVCHPVLVQVLDSYSGEDLGEYETYWRWKKLPAPPSVQGNFFEPELEDEIINLFELQAPGDSCGSYFFPWGA